MAAGQIPATATRHTALIKLPKPSGTSRVLRQPPWWGLLATLGVPPGGGFGQARRTGGGAPGRGCRAPPSARRRCRGSALLGGLTRSAARGRAGSRSAARARSIPRRHRSPGGGFGCCCLSGGLLGPHGERRGSVRQVRARRRLEDHRGCRPLAQPAEKSRDQAGARTGARSFVWRRLRGVTCRLRILDSHRLVLGDADRIRPRFRFRFRLGLRDRRHLRLRDGRHLRPRVRRLGLTDDTELIDTRDARSSEAAWAVSTTRVPHPDGSSRTVPLARSPSQATAVSGSSLVMRISPNWPRWRASDAASLHSAHNSGGDLTRVRLASCSVMALVSPGRARLLPRPKLATGIIKLGGHDNAQTRVSR